MFDKNQQEGSDIFQAEGKKKHHGGEQQIDQGSINVYLQTQKGPHPAMTSPFHPPPPLLSHLPSVSKCFLWPEWNLLRGARALWRKHN